MSKFESIFLFVFIFSVLTVLRTVIRFMGTLLQSQPERFVLSNRVLIYLALSVSYIITYLIKS
jgi:hypothetical protein